MRDTNCFPSSRIMPRFNLLTLLVLVTVVAIILGRCAQLWHNARYQHQAVAQVQRLGGSAEMAEPTEARGIVSGWLHFFLGDEYFARVCCVSLPVQSEADLHVLDAFPHLEQLQLSGPGLTDAAIVHLARFTQLKGVSFTGASIGRRSLKTLVQLRNLHSLYFWNCTLFDGPDLPTDLLNPRHSNFKTILRGLSRLSQLRFIGFHGCGLSDDSLDAFYGARSVLELHLVESDVTEAGILALRDANPTWSISFGQRGYIDSPTGKRIRENYLPSVQQLPLVKDLIFRDTNISDATLALLVNARSLTTLSLRSCRITDDGLKNLSKLTRLTHLTLVGTDSECQITDQGLQYVSDLTALKELAVYNCPITDQAMPLLSPLKQLTSLSLSSMGITDEGLRNLAGLRELRVLQLFHTNIRGHGLKWLPMNISSLNLENTPLTDEGVTHLARLKSLKTLLLSGTAVTDAGITKLRKAMPNCNIRK